MMKKTKWMLAMAAAMLASTAALAQDVPHPADHDPVQSRCHLDQ
ncbi:hypothetical protein [Devosia ginsengisoli]|nr:hypothetical protein [Devosia ginsengisoli]